jgi:2-dehydro-3-deoxy-D-arabinonate dehydratase
MKAVQYRRRRGLGVAVLMNDDADGVDVTEALASLDAPGAGLVRAIAHARATGESLADVLERSVAASGDRVVVDLAAATVEVGGDRSPLAVPVVAPETWGAGLTYLRSREAREAESEHAADVYTRVYDAERPELFFKDSGSRRTVASGEAIGARADCSSTVPEPELALILDAAGRIVAATLSDDVTARAIEAENPLYLPQAKIYAGSCALGPCALVCDRPGELPHFDMTIEVRDAGGTVVYESACSTTSLRRRYDELVAYLRRANVLQDGTVLMTGTGMVPPDEFTLEPGHVVTIAAPQIGALVTPVVAVEASGAPVPPVAEPAAGGRA